MEERALIEQSLQRHGLTVEEWHEGDDGLEATLKGRWRIIEDNEDRGLYLGDEGGMTVCVVGAPEYGNQRVCYTFTPDQFDIGNEVVPFEDVEPL